MKEGYKDSVLGKIPKSWEVVTFGSTLSSSPEYGGNASAKEFNNDTFRYIRITDILENGKLRQDNYVGISQEEGRQCKLKQDDILIARTGNTVGKSYLYDSIDGSCSFAGYLIRFSLNKTILQPKYISQYLHSKMFWNWINTTVRTGAQPNVNSKEYQGMKIPLPPLPEQQKIAEILSTVDAKIEVIDQQITATQALKKGLMQRLLTKGIGHTEFKDSPLGMIPKSWEVVQLGELATIERGKFQHRPRNDPRFYGGKYPFVQTGDIAKSNGKILDYSQTLNELGLSVSKLFPSGTIVMTIAANIGDTAISQFAISFPDSLVGIISKKGMNNIFLRYYLVSQKNSLDQLATISAQKNINLETLRPYKTPKPPLIEQQKIADILSSVDEKLEVLKEKKTHYQELKQGLMQQLLTGKIRATV